MPWRRLTSSSSSAGTSPWRCSLQAGPETFVREFVVAFKWHQARGQAELRLYEFDGKTDLVVNAPRPGIGHAKHDKFTVLLIIGCTISDLETRD